MIPSAIRETLKIIVDGEEVPGIIAYGLRRPGDAITVSFPVDAWKAQPDPTYFTLHGEGWEVIMWEVPIVVWPAPSAMESALRATLGTLLDAGCRVAWIGAEGLPFCDPPELFDPSCMSGAVLAWMTDTGSGDCRIDPGLPIAPVGDDVLLALRAHATGLADAT